MVNCGRPGVWSVVGLLYAKRARCARRGFAAYVSAVPSLCSLLPAAELRIQCFSLRFVPRYSEYIRGVRDLDRNLSINTKYIYSSSIVDRARLFQTPPSTKVQLSPGWVGCYKYLWYAWNVHLIAKVMSLFFLKLIFRPSFANTLIFLFQITWIVFVSATISFFLCQTR